MTKSKAVVTYQFNALPEKVYDAWINPEKIKKWMFPNGNIVRCENNPKVGGYFIFVDRREGDDIEHIGQYLELDKPNLIKFTWATVDDLPDIDMVTVEIQPSKNGAIATLTHEIDPNWAQYIPQTENAWNEMLKAMEEVLN
ncbi:SRPBCC family protein [Gracilibacillus dipsosauri]|uniref:SRPBCC family protein n=1 Tax=Gracilibacillus dipsosauri TaxID=178340 RepID=UPI0024098EB4